MRDCFSAYAGTGGVYSVVNAGVEMTPAVPVGFGMVINPDGLCRAWGVNGRTAGRFELSVLDLPFNAIFLLTVKPHGERVFFVGGTRYGDEDRTGGWNRLRWGRLGGHVGLIAVHAGVYFEVVEFVDLVLGWFGLDVCEDDWWPTEPEEPEGS